MTKWDLRLTCSICACALLALSIEIMAEDKTPPPPKKQPGTSSKGLSAQRKKAPVSTGKTAVTQKTNVPSHTPATTAVQKSAAAKKGTRSAAVRTRTPAVVRQQTPSVQRYAEIQQALADKGHYKGPVNGQWGPESVEALKSFQAENHLVVDGKLGALSLIALGLGPQHTASSQVPASAKPGDAGQIPTPETHNPVSAPAQPPGQAQ